MTYRSEGLKPLVDAGLLAAGATLFKDSKGSRRVATVDAEGRLHLDDGTMHRSPSSAARRVARHSVNGWSFWRVERGGSLVSLSALRDELGPKQEPAD